MKFFLSALLLLFFSFSVHLSVAQDTLPKFTVKNRFGKVILGWVNPFEAITQISIQRSFDSLKGYKTILTLPDPAAVTNGYLDSKAPNTTSFYRLYIQLPGGRYLFSKPSRPFVDSSRDVKYEIAKNGNTEKRNNGLPPDSLKVKKPELKDVFTPSVFVYTNPDGHIVIALPEQKTKDYTIKFFKEDGTALFQMNKIKESLLTLDKANFIQSGWFKFELYENNVLKEKHKLLIPKEQR
ncbi:MAG: hypothetical protein SFU87_12275 [Chitinophagaceae bacterium]|nr:hypothetical protein [Chitinophagaceae bacterium]